MWAEGKEGVYGRVPLSTPNGVLAAQFYCESKCAPKDKFYCNNFKKRKSLYYTLRFPMITNFSQILSSFYRGWGWGGRGEGREGRREGERGGGRERRKEGARSVQRKRKNNT